MMTATWQCEIWPGRGLGERDRHILLRKMSQSPAVLGDTRLRAFLLAEELVHQLDGGRVVWPQAQAFLHFANGLVELI